MVFAGLSAAGVNVVVGSLLTLAVGIMSWSHQWGCGCLAQNTLFHRHFGDDDSTPETALLWKNGKQCAACRYHTCGSGKIGYLAFRSPRLALAHRVHVGRIRLELDGARSQCLRDREATRKREGSKAGQHQCECRQGSHL